MKVYFVGYMGSGKSKVAGALAKHLSYTHIDTDSVIESDYGNSISFIFEKEGQDHFRELEKNILRSTKEMKKSVISTGGGTPCYFDNMDWMNENGLTVYLEANPGLLFHRLATSRDNRPLIRNLDDVELMEQISGHLATRIPVYRKAKLIVNAADINIKLLAEKIKEILKKN